MTETEIRKGLAGVVADTTAVSKVNAETNSLLYRGYPVQELAAKCSPRKSRCCCGPVSCPRRKSSPISRSASAPTAR